MTTRLIPLLLLSLLLAVPALANPNSRIVVTTDKPVVVVLDGEFLEYVEGTTNVEKWNLTSGRHVIEFKNMVGKTLHEAELVVPGGGPVEVRARYTNGRFELVDTVFVKEPAAEVVVVDGGHRDHESVSVSIGIPGAGVTVTESSSTGHESVTVSSHAGGTVVVVEESHHDHVAVPAPRNVTFRVTDDSWSNVYVDGKKVYEPRAMAEEKTITLSVGEHTIEVKDFMDDDVWCKGTLYVDGHTDLVIGLAEEQPIEVFNDRSAFRAR